MHRCIRICDNSGGTASLHTSCSGASPLTFRSDFVIAKCTPQLFSFLRCNYLCDIPLTTTLTEGQGTYLQSWSSSVKDHPLLRKKLLLRNTGIIIFLNYESRGEKCTIPVIYNEGDVHKSPSEDSVFNSASDKKRYVPELRYSSIT